MAFWHFFIKLYSPKRGAWRVKRKFFLQINKDFRPFFRPHSQPAYLHYLFQFLVLYGTTSILRYNIGMANILQGCQKRFGFVSWFQLMLYPHSCCCFDFWRQLISAVCLLFQFFTLTSFSVGWQCWLDCYSISIFHRKNGTIDFVKIYFLFCFYIFFYI